METSTKNRAPIKMRKVFSLMVMCMDGGQVISIKILPTLFIEMVG
jgi:hypothetical protein